MDRGPAPQGLQDSAQSFNPGNPHNKRFALIRRYIVAPCWKNTRSAGLEVLKGREMRVPDEGAPVAAQRSECAIGTCDNWTVGPRFRLVRTFDLAPPSGRVALGGRFPGLKPWAEFCSPFRAQTRPQPKECGLQPFGANPRATSRLQSKPGHSLELPQPSHSQGF
jgi:hypothetical protein